MTMSVFPIRCCRAAMLVCALVATAAQAQPPARPADIPLSAFVAGAEFNNLRISPGGSYYAVSVPQEKETVLLMLHAADLQRAGHVKFDEEAHVTGHRWVNDQQLVFVVATQRGRLAQPRVNNTLYLTEAEGGKVRAATKQMVWLHDTLRDSDDHVLVGHFGVAGAPGVSRMDLRNGRVEINKVGGPPIAGPDYYTDPAGRLRLAVGYRNNEMFPGLYRRSDEGEWLLVHSANETRRGVGVLGFSADGGTAYVVVEENEGPDGIYSLDLSSGELRLAHRDPRVDPAGSLVSAIDGSLLAVRFLDGRPKLWELQPDAAPLVQLRSIQRAFPDSLVLPTSYTRDGKQGIYLVSSDTDPGQYFHVDHASGQARFVVALSRQLPPALMSPTEPIRLTARDGLELDGLLTRPVSAKGRPAPLVVLPHGGPIGVHDAWGFDPEVQMLASRGFAVLQVNFRGSGNRGKSFRERGNGEYGRGMINDLEDATRWALAQGVTEQGRICAYGASYGAYAAMMLLAGNPDLFACGVGNVGVYDIRRMIAYDSLGSRSGKAFYAEVMEGVEPDSISPVKLAGDIRVPVLLGAGDRDRVAPPEQTRWMAKALREAGVPVEEKIYLREEHGNFLTENRLDWAQRLLAFLELHIGDTAASAKNDSPSPDHAVHLRQPAPAGARGP
ncbi:S9 family peptidase [Arenimonas aestuarii]